MRNLVVTMSVLGLAWCSGCTSVAKRGLAEVRGASASIHSVQSLSPGTAKAASSHKIAPVAMDGSGAGEFRAALQKALTTKFAEARSKGDIKAGSGGPLTIKTTVRFYSAKGAGKLMGGMAFAIVRVDVTDAKGQVVGKADALSSTKALRTGAEDLANAVAEKIIAWASSGKT